MPTNYFNGSNYLNGRNSAFLTTFAFRAIFLEFEFMFKFTDDIELLLVTCGFKRLLLSIAALQRHNSKLKRHLLSVIYGNY